MDRSTRPGRGSDLARRSLHRRPWSMIEAPAAANPFDADADWHAALLELIRKHAEFDPPELYCLRDTVSGKYLEPYVPEKVGDEQEAGNAIRVLNREGHPVEVSKLRPPLEPITGKPQSAVRYFVPQELRQRAAQLRVRLHSIRRGAGAAMGRGRWAAAP